MTLRQAVTGFLQLCAFLFSLATGAFLVCLWCLPHLALSVNHALETQSNAFAMIGCCVLGFSLLLGMWFLYVSRGRVLLLRMGTSVDVKLLRQSIAPLLERQFGDRIALRDVQIFRGKELSIGLCIGPENREALLSEAETCLQGFLIERFGFKRPFLVQVSE
jgi:hypothetical protein